MKLTEYHISKKWLTAEDFSTLRGDTASHSSEVEHPRFKIRPFHHPSSLRSGFKTHKLLSH
jgi:hypothetical protein